MALFINFSPYPHAMQSALTQSAHYYNNSWHYSLHCVPALGKPLLHVIGTVTMQNGCHYFHFIGKKTDTQRRKVTHSRSQDPKLEYIETEQGGNRGGDVSEMGPVCTQLQFCRHMSLEVYWAVRGLWLRAL
jgi:hypothetical protein